jgi:CheY-like chemotaxis protein
VEESEDSRRLMARVLSFELRHVVLRQASGGADAVAALTLSPPERWPAAVVLNYYLSDMDGAAVAREMRRRGYRGVIIGVTDAVDCDERGAAAPVELEAFRSAGVNAVLGKPLDLSQLCSLLVRALTAWATAAATGGGSSSRGTRVSFSASTSSSASAAW